MVGLLKVCRTTYFYLLSITYTKNKIDGRGEYMVQGCQRDVGTTLPPNSLLPTRIVCDVLRIPTYTYILT